ncbi:MAG: hypothetical protein ABWX72_20585 [Arthrobacter sp.]
MFLALALMTCRDVTLQQRGAGKLKGPAQTGDAFHEVVIDGNN